MEFNIIFFTIVAVLLHITGSNLVFTWDSSGKNNQNDDQHENSLSSGGSFEKRQLVPMPRIGRSLLYSAPKRQSLIPTPRIGRSGDFGKDSQPISIKTARSIDCNINPEMCETVDSLGGYAANNNDELVEPIDIQLRAAFIPRLGKRGNQYLMDDGKPKTDANKYSRFVLLPGNRYYQLQQQQPDLYEANIDPSQYLTEEEAGRAMLMRSILENNKRAIPYTPRIGRAVFAPRIGKKATFVPRIG